MHLDYRQLQLIDPNHGLAEEEIKTQTQYLSDFLERFKARKQGFYEVVDDKNIVEAIERFSQQVAGKYKAIVVLGIGGSALGTLCLQQSLTGLFSASHTGLLSTTHPKAANSANNGHPHLYILDNIDPVLMKEAREALSLEETLFIVVTKSGTTPETIAQYFYFRHECEAKGLDPREHFVIITDPEQGFLRKVAENEDFPSFPIPPTVGGRFSVLTAVGLLPARLIGINIHQLLEGARQARDMFVSTDASQNISFQLAAIQYLLYQKDKTINVLMPYAQKLIRFADWYRQLLAESIGKRLNDKGEEVFVGITPVNALGVTDQHSQTQLYNEGPNDKLHIFLEVKNHGSDLMIPALYPQEDSLKYLQNISLNTLLHTEMAGTIASLTQNQRPNITLAIDTLTEETLGELFMLFEGSIAFLGEFFEINAFDQPGVELSKQLTKKMLQK